MRSYVIPSRARGSASLNATSAGITRRKSPRRKALRLSWPNSNPNGLMRKTALDMVYELAKRDPRVVFIGSDLGPDTLKQLKAEMPKQFLMEGVSEANIVSMAAGLAMEGKIPYINTIATFLTRRCFEQIVLDLGLLKTKVRLIASGAAWSMPRSGRLISPPTTSPSSARFLT